MSLPVFLWEGDDPKSEDLAEKLCAEGLVIKALNNAISIDEALSEISSGPAVLIVDLEQPGLNINEVVRLKKRRAQLSLLATSSRTYNPEVAECIEKYFFALLRKPVDEEELLYLLACIAKSGKTRTQPDNQE